MQKQKKKKIGNIIITVLLITAMLAGVSLLLYPTFANWWNQRVQSGVLNEYVERTANLSDDQFNEIFERAARYNEDWKKSFSGRMHLNDAEKLEYNSMLNVGSDAMGYIEIPAIDVRLPIYYGTSEAVLARGVGHLEWSALPIGGEGTHSVLSGHRGLPSARLFTDLPKLIAGDYFIIYILNEVYTYEVDQILIVEPEKTDDLMPVAGQDYCTLVTCTPYGVNSHRILVRGHRTENSQIIKSGRIEANAVQISNMLVALFIGVPVLTALFFGTLITSGVSNRKKRRNKNGKDSASQPEPEPEPAPETQSLPGGEEGGTAE